MPRLLGLLAVLLAPTLWAQEPIRMARTPDISPDGKLIAFSYLGDIWTVEANGGLARPLTQHVAHDYFPRFSPDGGSLAFASKRHGSYDVFVVPARGGKPRRLTFDSAVDIPTGWSPDGKHVLFMSYRAAEYPGQPDLYSVPVEGGRVKRVSFTEAREGVWSPKGDQLAYVRGPGEWYRKGYRGSSNNDIWLCDANAANHRQLSTFVGQDAAPMWTPDGKSLYYVSEVFGTPANLVKQDVAGSSKPTLVTADANGKPLHTVDGVRIARLSGNGEWIVYECGADLWLLSTKAGSQPRRLNIEAHADDKTNQERNVTFTQRATEFAVARDETNIAFVVHGEIFLRPVLTSNQQTRRLTNHPANDHGIAWAPDSSRIAFLSDRNGHEDVYLLEADDPEHPKFTQAHQFKVKQLTNTVEGEAGLTFSPDGSRLYFLRSGRLMSMKADGTDVKAVVETPNVIDYEWSPDGKWIVYSRMDGSFASELYIVPSAGGAARNVTRFATENAGVTWSNDGKKLCFLSNRRGSPGVYVMNLQKEAAPGATGGDDIDWEDIHLRVQQVFSKPASEAAISADGSQVAVASQNNVYLVNVNNSSETPTLATGVNPAQLTWSRRNPSMLFFRDGSGRLHLGHAAPTRHSPLEFKARMTINDPDVFLEMFDQSWRHLADQFYDAKHHGADWKQVRERYRPLVKHLALKEDLHALLYLMMGELNASHLGVTSASPWPEELTADLGLLFDDRYEGRGLKIAEVLKRGPADRRGLSLKPGEFILAIDGVEIAPTTNVNRLLNDRINEVVALHVSATPAAGLRDKSVRRVEIKAVNRETTEQLMYERWLEGNARKVAELSSGKLGYIHVPSMNEAGMDRFVRSLYSDNYDKEAIVLDVRFNGGGFTHDQMLNYLGSKAHTVFRFRDGGEGVVLRSYDRKWSKPVVLLINNRSYSDAEIFPHAFRTLGLGKLVGQATGGHVIGTGSVELIDGSRFRMPRIGVYTLGGINMDREGVKPDVEVIPHPEQLARGHDAQLEKAVEVLKEEVAALKKKGMPVTSKDVPTVAPMPPAGGK